MAKQATRPQIVGPSQVRRDLRPAIPKAHMEKVQGMQTQALITESLERDPKVDRKAQKVQKARMLRKERKVRVQERKARAKE